MRVFMGKKVASAHTRGPVGEVISAGAVFARLVMLEPFAADRVADGKEEIIMAVVVRLEQLRCLFDEIAMELQFFGRDVEFRGPVCKHIKMDTVIGPRR